MTLFTDPKIIVAGDTVYFEYDNGKRAFGTVIAIEKELTEVDFTTEQSKEPKIEKFREGFWKKDVL